jgi:DNA-binding NarL/FixJ family response regulator
VLSAARTRQNTVQVCSASAVARNDLTDTRRRNIRIVLADDNPFVLGGLRGLIQDQPDLELVGNAGDGVEALRIIKEQQPDIAVLDISMPYLSGLGVARLLSPVLTSVRFLALTQNEDPDCVREAFQAGLRGYLLKGSATAKLNEAIHKVFNSKVYIDPAVVRRIRSGSSNPVIDWEARYGKHQLAVH